MVVWDKGTVSVKTEYGADFDALEALVKTSIRYAGCPPNMVPLKDPLAAAVATQATAAKRQRVANQCSTEGGADEIHGMARVAMMELGEELLHKHGFAGSDEQRTPFIQSAKFVQPDIIRLAGHFHCKIAGRYHNSNRQYFNVRKDGTVRQFCFHDGCKGSAAAPPLVVDPAWFVPPAQ